VSRYRQSVLLVAWLIAGVRSLRLYRSWHDRQRNRPGWRRHGTDRARNDCTNSAGSS